MVTIKKISLLTLSILFIISHLNTTVTYARRAIPDDNLVYPVLVIHEKGTGSGFYLNKEKYVFFVTARHVIFKESKTKDKIDYLLRSKNIKLLSYSKDPKDQGRIIFDFDLESLNNDGLIRFHKNHDVAVVLFALMIEDKEGIKGLRSASGVHLKEKTGSNIVGVDLNNIKKFDAVLISNDIFIFGYPTSIGIKRIPQIEYDRPLLRRGIVAGLNRNKKTIILDCPTYPGNSGGPVLEVDQTNIFEVKYRIIGVLSQLIPFARANKIQGHLNVQISNSGYSVATPMDPVLDLISDFEGDDSLK